MLFTKIKPMLAKPGELYNDARCLYEPKVDGIRLLLHCVFNERKVGLYTRHGTRITNQFPEFQSFSLPGVQSIILDGELTHLTNGQPNFNKVMKRFSAGTQKTAHLAKQFPCSIVVFDILYLNGKKVIDLPLIERKQILANTVPDTDLVCKVFYLEKHGTALFNQIVERKLEGIMVKPLDSPYFLGKRGAWIKHKNYYRDSNMEVLGYIYGTGRLLVGKNNRPFAQALGLPTADRDALIRLLPEIEVNRVKDTVFIKKGINCKIKYTMGAGNNIRECVFDGWNLFEG
ncbi:MAG: hypothetical protein FH756_20060 [Firmicutes bacterium]|nr:hypothetical protein [Bacillota bacterium]